MAKQKAWDTNSTDNGEKTTEKTVDEKIAGFERDLNRFDRAMDAKKDKIKSDVEDLEHSFDDFMDNSMDGFMDELKDCCGLDMDKMKDQFEAEMAALKKELEFSTKAVKKSFDHLMGQYKDRDRA